MLNKYNGSEAITYETNNINAGESIKATDVVKGLGWVVIKWLLQREFLAGCAGCKESAHPLQMSKDYCD